MNKLQQIEPVTNDTNDSLTKQECKGLKELQEDENLLLRKAVKVMT